MKERKLTILGKTFSQADARRVIWTALQAGIAAFLTVQVTDVKTAKVAAITLLTAAGAAALSAVKNWFLAENSPAK